MLFTEKRTFTYIQVLIFVDFCVTLATKGGNNAIIYTNYKTNGSPSYAQNRSPIAMIYC